MRVRNLAEARRRRAAARAAIVSVDPATGATRRTFEPVSQEQLDEHVARAAAAFGAYRHTPLDARRAWLLRVADILDRDREALATLITGEMGKPLGASRDELAKCALGCRYYADHAAGWLADEVIGTGAARTYVRYEPLGPVLAVMPWNFPFWQVFRFTAPALMAGNVVLLKHASNVPECALAIERVVDEAGFPPDVFQTLLATSGQVERILDDERVTAATLTGSEAAGAAVAARAGSRIKKTVLELGGSDPFIVTPNADLARAAATAVKARAVNNGQSCIAAKRFIAVGAIADAFEAALVDGFRKLVVGDPMDASTDVGPLVNADAVDTLDRQVQQSVEAGARILVGGHRLDRPGFFYAPTVLADVTPDAPAYAEETFGPVATLFRVSDVDAAIALANDTTFGLGASAWTHDSAEQERFIAGLEAGMVYVNAMVASDPRLPFGGVKRSGYGRELGVYGLREFVNIKTVWIADGGQPAAGHAIE